MAAADGLPEQTVLTLPSEEWATLVAREERMRRALAAGRINTWEWDLAADRIDWSEGLEQEVSSTPPPINYSGFLAMIHPQDREFVAAKVAAALTGPDDYDAEFRLIRPDGSVRWSHARATIVRDREGRAVRMVGIDVDVSEKRDLLRRMRESENRLRFALEAADAGTWEYAVDRDEFIASDKALELYGLKPGSIVSNRQALDAVHPDDRERVEAALRKTLASGAPFREEMRSLQPDGSMRWVLSQAVLHVEDGERRLIGMVQDITGRKEKEQALLRTKDRFTVALRNSPTAVFEQDRDLRYTWIHNAKLGYEAQVVIGRTEAELLAPECVAALAEIKHRVMATGTPERQEVAAYAPGGQKEYFDLWVEPHRDEAGRVVGVICAANDITERKRAEDRLRESETLLRLVFDRLPDPVIVSEENGRVVLVNRALTHLTGYTLDDIPTHDAWTQLAYGEEAGKVRAAQGSALETGGLVDCGEVSVRTKEGGRRVWRIRAAPTGRDAFGARLLLGLGQDVTDRKAAETRAERSQAQLQIVAGAIPVMLSHFDAEQRYLFANRATLDFLRKAPEEVLGRRLQDVVSASTYEGVREKIAQALSGSNVEFEFVGSIPGLGRRVMHMAFVPERDADGRVCGFVNASTDITAGRQIEEALRDSEARNRAAMSLARMAAWETDYKAGVRRWAPEALAVFGIDLPDGIGVIGGERDEFLAALHPEDRAQYFAFREIEARQDTFGAEYRIVRADGQTRWMSGYGHIVERSQDGEPLRMVNVAVDVTERRAAEENVRFLMRELSHRSKNTLAVVQAIVSLSKRNSETLEIFVSKVNERLRALADSNDLLASGDWKGASLEQLVRRQLTAFMDAHSAKLSVRGPALVLTADAVHSFGLAIHELATNAAKYGALSVEQGHVHIEWSLQVADGRRALHMNWREEGGPSVSPPLRSGFGQRVIKDMIQAALSASVELQYLTDGVRWSVTAPADRVLQD